MREDRRKGRLLKLKNLLCEYLVETIIKEAEYFAEIEPTNTILMSIGNISIKNIKQAGGLDNYIKNKNIIWIQHY